MKAFIAVLLLNLSVTLPYAFAVSPADCNAVEHVAGKALDLVNKGRRDGYLFKLLRVADAHLEKGESSTVYYLALDVIESDCSVLSRKFWEDCELVSSRSPSHTVIGQCKVIATQWDESQNLRVKHFNCTTSSVSSALSNTKDSPVLVDFFEDTESYKKQAEKVLEKYIGENSDFASFKVDQVERVSRVRGEERTNYYIDFSVRNCSAFPRHSKIFGFCNALLSYDPGASDLETPKDTSINCEVFHTEEHRNLSSHHPFFGHHHHFGRREHSHEKMPPFRFRYRVFRVHHSHQPHTLECPPPGENQSLPSQTATPTAPFPSRSRCHHPHFDTNGTHGPPHNQSASEHHPHKNHSHPHGHHPHGHHPHGHHPHGHHPHGHHPHGHHIHGNHSHSHHAHGQRPHGHHPHGHHPHGHHPHGHHPHGHHPHGHHPHGHHFPGHGFIDYGPCDPPSHRHGPQDHHHHGHGPPPRDSEERGPGRGNFPFHWGPFGYVYQLPPLKTGEFLPLPEANFTIIPLPHHNHSRPELQPFPQSTSESCPGKQQADFPRVSKFFEDSK